MSSLGYPDLRREIDEIGQRNVRLKDDELFVVWFLCAAVTDDESAAVGALTGLSGEKNLDGVLIDDAARAVFLVQAKFRSALDKTTEKRNDVMGFAEAGTVLYAEDAAFEVFCE